MKDHGVWLVLALVALRYVDEANLSSGAGAPLDDDDDFED
jgi:hypothetical protein